MITQKRRIPDELVARYWTHIHAYALGVHRDSGTARIQSLRSARLSPIQLIFKYCTSLKYLLTHLFISCSSLSEIQKNYRCTKKALAWKPCPSRCTELSQEISRSFTAVQQLKAPVSSYSELWTTNQLSYVMITICTHLDSILLSCWDHLKKSTEISMAFHTTRT